MSDIVGEFSIGSDPTCVIRFCDDGTISVLNCCASEDVTNDHMLALADFLHAQLKAQ